MTTDRRILELALQGLEAERSRVEMEIVEIRKQLRQRRNRKDEASMVVSRTASKRSMSAAGRKAISDAMKKRWANLRKQGSKK